MSLLDWLFGRKRKQPHSLRIPEDPFFVAHAARVRKIQPSKALDIFGTNGKLYCSRQCAKRFYAEVLCTISRRDYLELQNGSCPPGPKCTCGMMFNSWR